MSDMLSAAFQRLSAAPDNQQCFPPYPFQMAVTEALLAGRRVVLRAPACSGKSLAGWLPWLAAHLSSYDFPPQMLHVLPDGAFYADVFASLGTLTRSLTGVRVTTQTESDSADPFFLGDACFTTIEQLLGAALHSPLGLHPNLANINAGVVFGSYLIFDEFPALSRPDTLLMWLGLLRRYYPQTPCLFTTTSLPRPLCRHIAEAIGAELLEFPDVLAGGRRTWSQLPVLSVEALLRRHRHRTIVVCNTIRAAQSLFRQLRRLLLHLTPAPELLLLHKYLFSRDRQRVEYRAGELFARNSSADAILITTSSIEVGTEYSADTLISEPAPPEQLLRRAGRCARFAGEEGRMMVTPLSEIPLDADYRAPDWLSMVNTLADGKDKTSAEELAIYDHVWSFAPPDAVPDICSNFPSAKLIDDFTEATMAHPDSLPEGLFTHIGAAIHRIPEVVRDPFELERLPLARTSLERGFRRWQAIGCADEWFALTPTWSPSTPQTPSWSVVVAPRDFQVATRLVMLNADAVSYQADIGLEFEPGNAYQSEPNPLQTTSYAPFDQHVERFEEHALRTLNAIERDAGWYQYVLRRLGGCWRISWSELDHWLRLSMLWHDAGKLTNDWQLSADRWQTESVRRPLPGELLARIDYQAQRDGRFPCPSHAQLSGLAMTRVFARLLGSHTALYQGTIVALCRHHGEEPCKDVALTPHPQAWTTLMELAAGLVDEQQLRGLYRSGWNTHPHGLPAVSLAMPHDPEAWMAYSLLVRAIRLADREVMLSEMLTNR